MGKAWWQQREVAAHVTSEVRKQRVMVAGAQIAVSFADPSPWDVASHS